MATVLSVGDIAIVQYNSSTTDSFTFVFLRDVEAGTSVSFTDNGWLAAGGFRAGEGTVTYTAAAAVTAGTIVTLTGLNLDDAGDQIIAYQGDPATPTILHIVDLADGNNTVAGDATSDNTTALPPGFTLDLNAVAVGFDNAIYAGPNRGSAVELSAAVSNSANWINSNSLATLFQVLERPVIDLDADNSTTGGRDYRAFVTSGGTAVKIADSDIDISDLDGTVIFDAEIHIRQAALGDVLSVNGALPAGIAASLYDPLTGVLTLTGGASHDAYEAAIRQIEFSTIQPIGTQKRIDVILFDGHDWSPEAKAFITVGSTVEITAAPVLDLDFNDSNGVVGADYTATFTSGGPEIPVADIDVSITDDDSAAIELATLGIFGEPQDVLSFTGPAGPITAAYDSAAGILTLTGPATLAEYQTALRQVVFNTTSTSTADRIIQVTVNDGNFDSNVGTTLMHVVANVPPALNLDADSSTTDGVDYLTTFTDGGPAVAIVDTDVLVTDSDDTELTSATVTLTNRDIDDVLVFNGIPPLGITASVYDPGTGILTLTGPASLAAYQTALQQITFDNTGTTPSTDTRYIDVVVNDGTAASNLAQAIIHVAQVNNNAPVVNLDADNSTVVGTSFSATFTEGGAPIPIADIDTLITDADSTTLASATITLTDPQIGGLLTATLPLPGGITASAYDPATGTLTLSNVASLADYETALEAIRFSAAGENPVAGSRFVEVVVNDGANNSEAATALLTVVAVNDAPALVVADASYQENADPVLLSPLASLTDADDTELNFAAVQITAGSFPGDGDILTVGGDTSGTGITFTWDPSQHALVFTGASSVANYQALLRTVAFESTGDNPTDFDASPQRTLSWSVSGGAAVTTATTTLDIVAVNDAPQETVAATAAYTEGLPVTISPAATASDVDNLDLVFGVVRIADGWVDGDVLTVNGLQNGTFAGIDFSYDADLRALLFSHPAPVADYQALMQAVQFGSTSENPTNFGANPTRTLGWGLDDGDDYSSPAQFTEITINAIDDPAVAQNDAVATTEDTAITTGNVFVDNGSGADSDPDSASFLVTAVSSGTLGAQFALPSGALLTLNADGTFSYNPNHLFDYLPTPDSGASNLTITDIFSYTITGGDTATVTVTVSGVDTDDTLLDSPGNDTLAGGIRDDLYYVNNTGDVVIEAANSGYDSAYASVNYTLPASNTVEVLNMLGPGLTGTGSEGPETLISSFGANTLIGLGGDDLYYVRDTSDVVIEAANGGNDTVGATVDYALPENHNIELLSMLGSGLTGTGSSGADTLHSNGGPNTLVGLGGDDHYYVNNPADEVIEVASGGYDIVSATVDYTLPAEVEALYLLGSDLTGTGSDNADSLLSSGGPNTLVGLGGDDLYYANNAADEVIEAANGGNDTVGATVDYALPENHNIELLSMLGSGLTGTGSSGADTLHSNGGPNTLVGLGGDDHYYVNNPADEVIEVASGGYDIVSATVDYTLPAEVEALYLLGSDLTGTGSDNADSLLSSGGPNTLVGLGGDDLYYANNAADEVIEAANGGYDTVVATVDYTLPANVEAMYMVGSDLTGTGSDNADSLFSNGGPNTLVGLGGDDHYYVNNPADEVIEAPNGGYDAVQASVSYTLPANVEALYMNGSGLTGTGSSGADTLITFGANTLVGDDGNDMFVFSAGSANGATVADFDRSEGDVLVFSGFGTEAQGATLTQIGTTDQWQIHSGLDTHNETIAFSNQAVLQAGDFVFV